MKKIWNYPAIPFMSFKNNIKQQKKHKYESNNLEHKQIFIIVYDFFSI